MIGLFVVAAIGIAVIMDLWELLDTKYRLTNVSLFFKKVEVFLITKLFRKLLRNISLLVLLALLLYLLLFTCFGSIFILQS